jgi:hypothetical protein
MAKCKVQTCRDYLAFAGAAQATAEVACHAEMLTNGMVAGQGRGTLTLGLNSRSNLEVQAPTVPETSRGPARAACMDDTFQ